MIHFKVTFKSIIQVQMTLIKEISRHEWVKTDLLKLSNTVQAMTTWNHCLRLKEPLPPTPTPPPPPTSPKILSESALLLTCSVQEVYKNIFPRQVHYLLTLAPPVRTSPLLASASMLLLTWLRVYKNLSLSLSLIGRCIITHIPRPIRTPLASESALLPTGDTCHYNPSFFNHCNQSGVSSGPPATISGQKGPLSAIFYEPALSHIIPITPSYKCANFRQIVPLIPAKIDVSSERH